MVNDPVIKDILRDINSATTGLLAERDRLTILYNTSLTGNTTVWELLPATLQAELRSVIVESFRRFLFALLLEVTLLNSIIALIASGGIGSGRFEDVGINVMMLVLWGLFYSLVGLVGALIVISRVRGKESVEK